MFSLCLLALRLRLERELFARILCRDGLVSETVDADTQELLLAGLQTRRPRVVLLDHDFIDPRHPDLDRARRACDAPAFVVLAPSEAVEHALPWLVAGIESYLPKTAQLEDLRRAFRRLRLGRRYIHPPIAEALVERLGPQGIQIPSLDRLSRRERQVFDQIADGFESPEIAEALGLSVKTVSTYRARMLLKLGLRNNAQVVLFALRQAGIHGPGGDAIDED